MSGKDAVRFNRVFFTHFLTFVSSDSIIRGELGLSHQVLINTSSNVFALKAVLNHLQRIEGVSREEMFFTRESSVSPPRIHLRCATVSLRKHGPPARLLSSVERMHYVIILGVVRDPLFLESIGPFLLSCLIKRRSLVYK